MKPQQWHIVRWVIIAQILLASTTAIIVVVAVNPVSGVMVMLGGLAATMVTAVFALRAFVARASNAKAALGAMYRAEALKMALATIFFVWVAMVLPDYFGSILLGFAAATLSFWLALPMTAHVMSVEAGMEERGKD